jgi:hypothetical protein
MRRSNRITLNFRRLPKLAKNASINVVSADTSVADLDVQHIKGLEFEGVFFVGVDRLADRFPDLFDKYLYVGTTRAAYYLGLTTEGFALPTKVASLRDAFGERWL